LLLSFISYCDRIPISCAKLLWVLTPANKKSVGKSATARSEYSKTKDLNKVRFLPMVLVTVCRY
jgi:hypothetical protein